MKVNVIQFAENLSNDIVKNKIAVVIDVFRATSVITTALAHGAKEILVTSEIEEALQHFKNRGEQNAFLGGERDMHKIEGFHFGNSPQSYATEAIQNKTIILTTTNGTKAIDFCKPAKETYICSLLNCSHLASELSKKTEDIIIICSGSKGQFSLEDALCAGMLVSYLENLLDIFIDDFSLMLKAIYKKNKNSFRKLLKNSQAYSELIKNKFKNDVDFCLTKNCFSIAPKWVNGSCII